MEGCSYNETIQTTMVLLEYDKADRHEAAFEKGFLYATRRELLNSKAATFMMKPTNV